MADTTSSKESISGTQKVIIQGIWATAFVGVACLGVFVLPKQFAPQNTFPIQNGFQQPQQYQQQMAMQQPGYYQQPGYAQQGQYQQFPQYQTQQMPIQQAQQYQTQQQPVQQTQQAQSNSIVSAQPITRQGIDSGYEISDLSVAGQLLNGLASLASISDTPAGQQANEKNTIVMFFDPRCPYCQAAHKALSGKYPIRFVPISVLGDQATQLDALPGIRGVLKQQDKVKALHNLMAQQTQGLDMSADANLDKEVNQNFEVWLTLAANLPDRAPAVPLFVVPKASGKVAVLKGWDDAMMPVVDALMKE
jgi:glutaredoxin